MLCEQYGYKLHDCPELTLPDIETLFVKLGPTVSEPEWFVKAVRGTRDNKTRLLALSRLMGG